MTVQDDFLSAIRQHGLTPPDRIVADGEIHRFRSGPERAENGFYRLVILPAHRGGEIGFGHVGCWKRDVSEKWCSMDARSITTQDRTALERLRERQRADEDRAAKDAARKAKAIWDAAGKADPAHPYLQAKRIGCKGIRQHKDALVVPVYGNGGIRSLQFISPDGSKRFLKHGIIEGGYASISGGSKERGRIVVAEGYATAASLHEATGLPVVVAFNAGNLMHAAKAMRAKYPAAELLIAADNDRFTIIQGEQVNVGINKAKQVADAVGGIASWPIFESDEGQPTDWNDFCVRYGTARTADAFLGRTPDPTSGTVPAVTGSPPAVPELATEQAFEQGAASDWKGRLIPGKEVAEGHPYPFDGKSKANAYLFLKHHQRFEGLLCYNEFTDSVMFTRRPVWDEGVFSPRPIRDEDFFMLAANLEYCDISVTTGTAAEAAVRVAKENSINPPREYLSRLVWDGTKRLNRWLAYYLGADKQPGEYLALVGSKWLIGAVSRVFEPGCKFDSVLILEGPQGLGKSMALRALATFGGQDFFLDSVGDIRSKDTLMTMQGKMIVEIAELASFRKSENEEIKAFITRQVDEYRPPYGRTVLKRPRYFVLAGSTNETDEGYLTDSTGNRRYWPVMCKAIDIEAIERDAGQLWAEAVSRYRGGERAWLSKEEAVFSASEQKQRFMEDAWQDRIADIVKNAWTVRTDEVLDKLELKSKDVNNMVKKRVKNSLRQLGWVETRREGEGRVWRPAERAKADE